MPPDPSTTCKCPEPTYRWDHDLCSACGAQIGAEHALAMRVAVLETEVADERMFAETLVTLADEEALGWKAHLATDETRSMRARMETAQGIARTMRARLAARIAKRTAPTPMHYASDGTPLHPLSKCPETCALDGPTEETIAMRDAKKRAPATINRPKCNPCVFRAGVCECGRKQIDASADEKYLVAEPLPCVPRWRVGRSLGRTLYRDGVFVGAVDTVEIAAGLVEAMNEYDKPPKERHGCMGCPMVNGVCPHCGNEEMP